MTYFNNYERRQEIESLCPTIVSGSKSKVLSFVNLCIYPHKFEAIYDSVRNNKRITAASYDALKGVILALLTLTKRRNYLSHLSIDHYILDFISFIKNDSKPDPERFLLSMKRYLFRYLFVRGLYVSFGIDWRLLVQKALDKPNPLTPKTYHWLLTNKYIRTLLYAYVVWKNYYETHDEGYEPGVNDVVTLLDQQSKYKTCISKEALTALFEALQESLPSYNRSIRTRAAWAIDRSLDGWYIVNKQLQDWKHYASTANDPNG